MGIEVFFLKRFSNSSPSILGILISITAKSGGVLLIPTNAVSASIYVWTLKPSLYKAILILVKIFLSSSTNAIVSVIIG